MTKLIFLIGPTAVGKSAAAIIMAEEFNAEIISCDSMQIYQGMKILSAQPNDDELKKVPHHLIAKLDPTEEYSASKFVKDAKELIKEISDRGKTPLFVVGTALYFVSLVDGLFETPEIDPEIRKNIVPSHDKLKQVDPEAAGRIHPNDDFRIIRALEVFAATGVPISKLRKETTRGLKDDPQYEIEIYGLRRERAELYQRINKRVEEMFAQGIVEEVKALIAKPLSLAAKKALGFSQIKKYLEDEYSRDEAAELLKRDTRHFARHQLIWFRKDKRIKWIDVKENITREGLLSSDSF